MRKILSIASRCAPLRRRSSVGARHFTGSQCIHQPIAPLPRRDNTCAVAFASNPYQEQTPTLMAIATEDERSDDADSEG
jgi:hypothetical protein